MGFVKGPGGSMKWVQGGGGWNAATGESTPENKTNIVEQDGKQYHVNPKSRHRTELSEYNENINR